MHEIKEHVCLLAAAASFLFYARKVSSISLSASSSSRKEREQGIRRMCFVHESVLSHDPLFSIVFIHHYYIYFSFLSVQTYLSNRSGDVHAINIPPLFGASSLLTRSCCWGKLKINGETFASTFH
jgi:hypothetical protein